MKGGELEMFNKAKLQVVAFIGLVLSVCFSVLPLSADAALVFDTTAILADIATITAGAMTIALAVIGFKKAYSVLRGI